MAILARALANGKNPVTIFNIDDTQISCGSVTEKLPMYSKKVYHKMGYQNGRVRIATNRPLVCRFYKMRVIVTRSGALGPVSVIIRDDRLDKDAFQYNKVHGFNGVISTCSSWRNEDKFPPGLIPTGWRTFYFRISQP